MKIIAVLNVGSSTLKCAVFKDPYASSVPLWKGLLEKRGTHFYSEVPEGTLKLQGQDFKEAAFEFLKASIGQIDNIDAVGHRVVHGGDKFYEPTLMTKAVFNSLTKLSHLAPLHNPLNLQGIHWAEKLFPKVPQVAIFDTAFHHTLPEVSYTYPVPLNWRKKGVRRYGFHGISHEGCLENLRELGKETEKIITCHLGNGCSLAAIKKGVCIDTTMGMTPMEGLMMGTRSGTIDPGIIFHLLREKIVTSDQLEEVLNKKSGLQAITGTHDMREILSRKDPEAKLGYALFCHRLVKEIGSLVAVLGGLDTLIFTGGIGENADVLRREVSKQLAYLDIELRAKKIKEGKISTPESQVEVFVFKAREEWQIAKKTQHLLF